MKTLRRPKLTVPHAVIASPKSTHMPVFLRARPGPRSERSTVKRRVNEVLDQREVSLLDLVDNLLNRGVLIQGEVVLGIAQVDLIFLRLQVILCAADKILPPAARAKATR